MTVALPLLAACGLFYASIATDSQFPQDWRAEADRRLDNIIVIARNQNALPAVTKLVDALVERLMTNPAEGDRMMNALAQQCHDLTKETPNGNTF